MTTFNTVYVKQAKNQTKLVTHPGPQSQVKGDTHFLTKAFFL